MQGVRIGWFSTLIYGSACAVIASFWIFSAHRPDVALIFGRYTNQSFFRNFLATYALLILAYVFADSNQRKIRARKVALQIGTILVLVIAIELPAVLGWIDYRIYIIPKIQGSRGPHNRLFDANYFHRPPNDSMESSLPGDTALLSGAKIERYYEATYRYDSKGFRNKQDLNQADIVLLGDSFLEGYKVTQDQIVSSKLAEILKTRVANLGQCDYGPVQEQAVFNALGRKLKPRMVVWFIYEGNDLQDYVRQKQNWKRIVEEDRAFSARSFFSNAFLSIMGPGSWAYYPLRQHVRARTAKLRKEIDSAESLMYFEPTPDPFGEQNRKYFDQLKNILIETRDACNLDGCKLIVAFVPMKFRVYHELMQFDADSRFGKWKLNDFPSEFSDWCGKVSIDFLSLIPDLQSSARKGILVYFLDDAHWTPAGNRVVAESVAAHIRGLN